MKRTLFSVLTIFLLAPAFAQLSNSQWKATLLIGQTNTHVIMHFKSDSAFLYRIADSSMIERMTYTIQDTTLSLVKFDGQSDCEDGSKGAYHVSIKEDSMWLSVKEDACDDRSSVINNVKWTRWKEYHGITMALETLKQYTGVYQFAAGHPITISLENGILYAAGPNNSLPRSPLTPIATNKFLLRITGTELEFAKDRTGRVSKLISHEDKEFELAKIK